MRMGKVIPSIKNRELSMLLICQSFRFCHMNLNLNFPRISLFSNKKNERCFFSKDVVDFIYFKLETLFYFRLRYHHFRFQRTDYFYRFRTKLYERQKRYGVPVFCSLFTDPKNSVVTRPENSKEIFNLRIGFIV